MAMNREVPIQTWPRTPTVLAFFVLAVALLLVSTAPALPADIRASNTVAVVDFELAEAQPQAKDWAFGLADVLAVELQRRGVVLFERQQIRLVLGERRITASGLVEWRKSAVQEIPDLQYLVTGSIRPLTIEQFHLDADLVEARTGRNVASFAR
jgi:TolB-like protein